MKNLQTVILVLLGGLFLNTSYGQQRPEEELGWKLGVQASSWNELTLAQVADRADSCGIRYIEAVRDKPIGGGVAGNLDLAMDADKRAEILAMLQKKGTKLISIGVVNPSSEAEWRQLFEFAKGMKLSQFATEPTIDQLPLVVKLANEYKINVAIHNHPYPSIYWHPDTLIKYVKGRSPYLGACADMGHWIRAGVDPIMALKKYHAAGITIFESHFKDLNEKPNATYTNWMRAQPYKPWSREVIMNAPPGPHDVPWGTGISNIDAIILELKRQQFKGLLLAEYEWARGINGPLVAQCAINLRSKLTHLSAKP